MAKVTVFTPTYNRAYILENCYESLCAQSCKDFDWVIVDDGSTDNTKSLIDSWKKQNNINIKYIFQENSGKMRSHNVGVDYAKGELFVCLDSDDYLTRDAIEKIKTNWKNNDKEKLAGIIALKGKTEELPLTDTPFPNKKYSNLSNLYDNGFIGDTTLVYKTSILKKYPFPEIENEKFITERYIYDQIDVNYELILLPNILTICNYLDDGYTKNALALIRDNPKGWSMYFAQRVKLEKSFLKKFYNICQYIAMSKLAGEHLYKKSISKTLYLLALPFGVYLYYKRINQFRVLENGDSF